MNYLGQYIENRVPDKSGEIFFKAVHENIAAKLHYEVPENM